MEQATQTTEFTASPEAIDLPPERAAYQRACQVRDHLVARLHTVPRSDAVIGDAAGFMVKLNFGVDDCAGVDELGRLCTMVPTLTGSWYEARVEIDDVPVIAEVLISSRSVQFGKPATDRPDDTTPDTAPPAAAAPLPGEAPATAPAATDAQTGPVKGAHARRLASPLAARIAIIAAPDGQA
ncbi:hypothetical protein AB0F46_35375 [Streptomyces sp. NPDC026665]|uniref:hypothetical protein n=1 Tax=Streptomyces sp. NPDC026665 TaxID=3154798 RepID=UPI0033F1268D